MESFPGTVGKLLRRFGWLFGVYLAYSGAGFALIGGLARGISKKMFSGFENFAPDMFSGSTVWYDDMGNVIPSPFGEQASSLAENNPVVLMGTVILVIGIVLIIAGIILAVYLKRQSKNK